MVITMKLHSSKYFTRIFNRRYQSTKTHNLSSKVGKYCNYSQGNGYVWSSPYENIQIPNTLLHEHIWKDINKWQDKEAIVCGITGRNYTYAKLRDHSAIFSTNLLDKFKLKKNDVIAICLPNCPEYPIASLGAIEAGMIITTINPIYTSDEIAYQLKICKPKLIIGTADGYGVLKKACTIANISVKILVIKEYNKPLPSVDAINFFEMIASQGNNLNNYKAENNTTTADTCVLPFSSGTTGMPKGVMLNHINLNAVNEILNVKLPYEKMIYPTTNDFQDVLPCFLPFFHIYGLHCTLFTKLALGCKLVTLPKFDINTFANSLIEHKGTFLNLVPPVIIALSKMDQFTSKHLKSVRIVMTGAAPIGQSTIELLKSKKSTVKYFQGYGLTETSPAVLLASIGDENYASVGHPVSNTEVKIVSMNDNKDIRGLGPNEDGELLIRGPQVMQGYLNNEMATKDAITPDGWFRTGDIANYDIDGYFYIKDRIKEMIKVKGYQVAPAELEEVLRSHAKVLDAGVIGIPHPLKGEVPKAYVVKRPGVEVSTVELQNYVADKLSKYKHLDGGIQFIDSIPKNATGKILRKNLKVLKD